MSKPSRARASLLTGVALAVLTAVVPGVAAAAPADTYAAYSMLDQRSAGRFIATDGGASQWSWRTDQPGQYSISWDTSKPGYRERFIPSADGNWLFLDGWTDNNTYYTQRVTQESLGDGACNNMRPIPSDGGRQHYVRWTIPGEAYCLDAVGTITEGSSNKTWGFHHHQVWSPPGPCANAHFPARTCIVQHETWHDDINPGKDLDRSQFLAKGLGMAFKIRKTKPDVWSADLRDVWTY